MYQVLKWKLENDTLPDYLKDNAGCEINGDFIGIGIAPSNTFVFENEEKLIQYLETNNYGDDWGPRADGTTPIFDATQYATNVFARCAKFNDEL